MISLSSGHGQNKKHRQCESSNATVRNCSRRGGGRFLNVCARKLGVAQDKEGYEPDREGKRKKRAEREGGGGEGCSREHSRTNDW